MDEGSAAREAPRGFCGGGGDYIPDLNLIINEAVEAAEAVEEVARPKFEELRDLVKNYKTVNISPAIAENIKTTIKTSILTPQVRGIIAPVLVSLFGGVPTTDGNRGLHIKISDCILDALMDDFSVLDYVRMVCNIYIKAYYDDNIFRLGFATVYDTCVLYVFWNSGVGSFATYTTNQCLYLMSMFGHLLELANNHDGLVAALGNIIPEAYAGPSAEAIETIIQYLRDNATDSSNIKMMCAMGLIGLIHRFHPQGPLDGMRVDAAAAGVAPAGVAPDPLAPPPPPAAAAAPPPPAAAAAAPLHPVVIDSLFNSMFQPLRQGSELVVDTVNKYLAGLLNLLSGIAYRRVGVIAHQDDRISRRVSGYICRNIVDYLATIDSQGALLQGGAYSLLKAKITIDAVIKTQQLMDMTVEQSEPHILTIAGSIRSNVIDKLKTLRVGDPDEAADTKELEDCCPMFKSMLIERNIKRLEVASNRFMLRQLLPESSGPAGLSQTHAEYGESQTPAQRLASVDPDILKLINQGYNGIFYTDAEKQAHNRRQERLIGKGVDMVLVGPGRVFNSLKQQAYTGAVCGLFGFSKQVLLEGQHLLMAGNTPAPGITGPQRVGSAPLSAQYMEQINIINDEIKDKVPNTGITKDIRKEIREILQTKLTYGSSKLTDTELDELLNKIYYSSKIDEAERQGIQGTAVNFFHNGWRMIRNIESTSGLKTGIDAEGNNALFRTLKGSNEPTTLGSALAPASSVVRKVSNSIWNSVADFKDVICGWFRSSSEVSGVEREGAEAR